MALSVRQIYEDMPSVLTIPETLQHKRVEVILLSLDEMESVKPKIALDENGWPIGFIEQTMGAWQGEPLERGNQGEYPVRLELE